MTLVLELIGLAVVAAVAAPLALRVVRALRRRELGVDVIALLAMLAAVAVGEILAASVVAVMVAGGLALEDFASRRAKRELSALLARSPRTAHRLERGEVRRIDAAEVRPGDVLVVPHGEIVAVDGLCGGPAVLDESAVTGEAAPVDHEAGDAVRSGTVNAGAPFEMTATAAAEDSTYAAMVRLAREADAHEAPFVRMADRYAGWFLAATVIASAAAWAISGDPTRAVAVLVVATPCPLILAAPIALVSGISRAASRGILVKSGPALEGLSRARVLLMDKTGTATVGAASVASIVPAPGVTADDLLRAAASLDQVSSHVFAPAIVRAARNRGLALTTPSDVVEEGGRGIHGTVEGRRVAIGKPAWIGRDVDGLRSRLAAPGTSVAFVAMGGALAGAIVLRDPVRPDAAATVRRMRRWGIHRIVLLTGDHGDVAEAVGAELGVDAVIAEASAIEKVAVVTGERRGGVTVMVGDGVNDAAALARADVGVALGATGSAASVESADAVLLVDRLDRLAEAFEISGRAMAIARQSVIAGMGLSIAAMAAAAVGWLPPVAGALLQEGIDVAVILNALRARGAGRETADETEMDRGRVGRDRRRLDEPVGGRGGSRSRGRQGALREEVRHLPRRRRRRQADGEGVGQPQ